MKGSAERDKFARKIESPKYNPEGKGHWNGSFESYLRFLHKICHMRWSEINTYLGRSAADYAPVKQIYNYCKVWCKKHDLDMINPLISDDRD